MKKKLPRLFLAVMTVLCLLGAWLCPVRLALPGTASDYAFTAIRQDSGQIVRQDYLLGSPWEAHGFAMYADAMDTETAEELFARLQTVPLRQASRLSGDGSTAVMSGDIVYYVSLAMLRPGQPACQINVRISCTDGRVSGDWDVNGGRYYTILDPAPLLEFLQERVPVPV